jgi:hypothetical protein
MLNDGPADPSTKRSYINNQGALCSFTGSHFTFEDTCRRVVKDRHGEPSDLWWENNVETNERVWDVI